MHYYQKNIADYRKDTSHLSLLEHGLYNQIIDSYYLDEKPIETQLVIRRLSIKTQDELSALNLVLTDFFTPAECGLLWVHKRIDSEIRKYKAKADIAKVNGSKGGRPAKPKKTKLVNLANPEITGSKANHKPLTINQEPEKEKKKRFSPPTEQEVTDFMISLNWPADNGATARAMIDYYAQQGWKLSNGNMMKDWNAAARGWLRNQQKWDAKK